MLNFIGEKINPLDRFRFERGIDLLQQSGATIGSEARWLDLGCHQGQFLKLLIARFGLCAKGSDVWDGHEKGPTDSEWQYFQADFAHQLPNCGTVDFVSALEVLEHMIDTDLFLKRIYNLIDPGGWLLISTPNINSLRNRIMVPLGSYPVGLEFRNIIHHVRLYNPKALRGQLTDVGFRDIAMWGVSFLPLSSRLGITKISQALAQKFPSLCNNIIAVARKPDTIESPSGVGG